jgi:hypothetical protein
MVRDSSIELGSDRVLSVSNFLKRTYHDNWRGWETILPEEGISEKLSDYAEILHKKESDTLYVALKLDEENMDDISEYSRGVIEKIDGYIKKNDIKEVFFTGFRHGAELALLMADNLKENSSFHVNQIKVIIFGCPKRDSQINRTLPTELDGGIGKQNILHFRNKTWIDSSSELLDIGIPLKILLSERTFWGIPIIDESYEKKAIEVAFLYARTNYMTSPEASLNVIGIPLRGIPFASFLGLRGVDRRGLF